MSMRSVYDQADDAERSVQVSFMSRIFRAATKIIVWLGDSGDDSDMLFDLLALIGGRLDHLDSLVRTWSRAGVDCLNYTKARI